MAVISVLSMVLFVNYLSPMFFEKIQDNLVYSSFNKVSEKFQESKGVESLSYLCSLNNNDTEKVFPEPVTPSST